jgi:hypothetical protein
MFSSPRSLALSVGGALLLLALTACQSTPQQRVDRNADFVATLSEADQANLAAGIVEVGYTPQMVEIALGEPDEVAFRQTADGEVEVWGYTHRKPSIGIGIGGGSYGGSGGVGGGISLGTGGDKVYDQVVTFRDGEVVEIESRSR